MIWKVELAKSAVAELDKLDPQVAKRILLFLHQRVANLDNPRAIGEALKGARLGNFWKYRVGDWRVICAIQDNTVVVQVAYWKSRRNLPELALMSG